MKLFEFISGWWPAAWKDVKTYDYVAKYDEQPYNGISEYFKISFSLFVMS